MPYYGYRLRYRRRSDTRTILAAAGAGVVLALAMHGHHHGHLPPVGDQAGAPRGAAVAVAYAERQLGKPYVWGGTGPYGYDCSGLVMEAWAAAGVSIARTSQEQWATLPHVARPAPGDLVFFPGSDGTWAAPGHVALVISRTRMIQAYATGVPLEVSPLSGAGAGGIVGYARP